MSDGPNPQIIEVAASQPFSNALSRLRSKLDQYPNATVIADREYAGLHLKYQEVDAHNLGSDSFLGVTESAGRNAVAKKSLLKLFALVDMYPRLAISPLTLNLLAQLRVLEPQEQSSWEEYKQHLSPEEIKATYADMQMLLATGNWQREFNNQINDIKILLDRITNSTADVVLDESITQHAFYLVDLPNNLTDPRDILSVKGILNSLITNLAKLVPTKNTAEDLGIRLSLDSEHPYTPTYRELIEAWQGLVAKDRNWKTDLGKAISKAIGSLEPSPYSIFTQHLVNAGQSQLGVEVVDRKKLMLIMNNISSIPRGVFKAIATTSGYQARLEDYMTGPVAYSNMINSLLDDDIYAFLQGAADLDKLQENTATILDQFARSSLLKELTREGVFAAKYPLGEQKVGLAVLLTMIRIADPNRQLSFSGQEAPVAQIATGESAVPMEEVSKESVLIAWVKKLKEALDAELGNGWEESSLEDLGGIEQIKAALLTKYPVLNFLDIDLTPIYNYFNAPDRYTDWGPIDQIHKMLVS